MSKNLLGKNVRIKDVLYQVKAESKDKKNLILEVVKEKSGKSKKIKVKKMVDFVFGTCEPKQLACKKKLTKAAQLGYTSYEDISYPDSMMDKALDILKEKIGDKVPVSFFDNDITDGEIIQVTVDTVAFHPKKKGKVIVQENDGSTTNLPLVDLLIAMLFDQECLAVKEIFESDCTKMSNSEEIDRIESRKKESPIDQIENGLGNILKDLDKILSPKKSNSGLDSLSDILGGIISELDSAKSSRRNSNKRDDIDLGDMPEEIRTILNKIMK
ncbi:MAG: hypothetical protein ACTSWH_06005 [Promethearchaeota archaeon]